MYAVDERRLRRSRKGHDTHAAGPRVELVRAGCVVAKDLVIARVEVVEAIVRVVRGSSPRLPLLPGLGLPPRRALRRRRVGRREPERFDVDADRDFVGGGAERFRNRTQERHARGADYRGDARAILRVCRLPEPHRRHVVEDVRRAVRAVEAVPVQRARVGEDLGQYSCWQRAQRRRRPAGVAGSAARSFGAHEEFCVCARMLFDHAVGEPAAKVGEQQG